MKINPKLLVLPVVLAASAVGAPAFAVADPAVVTAGENSTSILNSLDDAAQLLPAMAYTLLGVAITGVVAKVGFKVVRRFIG